MLMLRSFWILPLLSICVAARDDLTVAKGQLTFDAEGNDNPRSLYFSRRLHVPSRWSGITIGRGYDIKYRRKHSVVRDLLKAGFNIYHARKISNGVGKYGRRAKSFIKKENLQAFTITRAQQKNLFKIAYAEQERVARRLVNRYYKVRWSTLNDKIQQVLVDLKFRGDFLPRSRSKTMKAIKSAVIKNDLQGFKRAISNRNLWRRVPYDRFQRRRKFLA